MTEPTDKIWLEAVITVRYLANPAFYGTSDPDMMAAIDESQLNEYSGDITEWARNADDLKISVRPVE